jgi:integrase
LLVITAAWTGCHWGEVTGLQRDHVDLARGVIVIDPTTALSTNPAHTVSGSGHPRHLPPRGPSPLPPFLIDLLRDHLATMDTRFVFTTRTGCPIRRSTFGRRVFRPAVDGEGCPLCDRG